MEKTTFNTQALLDKALEGRFLSVEEGVHLYNNAPLNELILVADEIRKQKTGDSKIVGWIIDRNVNITNICVAQCEFCNFYRKPGHPEGYITTMAEYVEKIDELFELGGDQLLLQGGLHPKLDLKFYTGLFRMLKDMYPDLKLHALSPSEVHYIAQKEGKSYEYVLEELVEAGLDSLPGAGAEILNDRVRNIISKGKCNTQQWLDVMEVAHKMNLPTSATMMFGHIETIEERIEHLVLIRDLQAKKPEGTYGFLSFIPWPFQDKDTELARKRNIKSNVDSAEYVRMIAISRIMLPNVPNIQASWLTVGIDTAQICLHAGANDMGSIMIEENVVSAAGKKIRLNKAEIVKAIEEAGFIPKLRNQKFEYLD
jgi:cyclic dehypoxanthinyl futalosine synthase